MELACSISAKYWYFLPSTHFLVWVGSFLRSSGMMAYSKVKNRMIYDRIVFNLFAIAFSSRPWRCVFARQDAAMRSGTRFLLTLSARGIVKRSIEELATPILTFDRSLIALMRFSGLPKLSRRREFKMRFIVLGRWTPLGYLMRSSSTWLRAEA